MSLDAPPDGYNMPVELEDHAAVLPEEELVAGDTRHVLASAVARLPDRQRSLVVRRFGLDGSTPVPQVVLAHELGVTRQRVGQIVAQAIRRLRLDPQIAELLGDDCRNRIGATTVSPEMASKARRASRTHRERRCGREDDYA